MAGATTAGAVPPMPPAGTPTRAAVALLLLASQLVAVPRLLGAPVAVNSSASVAAPRRAAPPRRALLTAPPPPPAPTCLPKPPYKLIHDGDRTYRGTYNSPDQLELTPSDLKAGDYFGSAVAISDDGLTVLVGGRGRDDTGADAGAGFILERGECSDVYGWAFGCYLETSRLVANTGAMGAMGTSVAMDGAATVALIGARGATANGNGAGGVYAFRNVDTYWQLTQDIILGPTTTSRDYLGDAVALRADGRLGAAGAYGEDPGGLAEGGGAYALEWNDGARRFEVISLLPAVARAEGERFGFAVAVLGDTIFVGAPGAGVDSIGSVYVFRRERAGCPHCPHAQWEQRQRLAPSAPQKAQRFGSALAVSEALGNPILAVGAEQYSSITAAKAGRVYLFALTPAYNLTTYAPHLMPDGPYFTCTQGRTFPVMSVSFLRHASVVSLSFFRCCRTRKQQQGSNGAVAGTEA